MAKNDCPDPNPNANSSRNDSSRSEPALEAEVRTKLRRVLPDYQVVRLLGVGGSGQVYEVLAPGNIRKALKVVPLDKHNPLNDREQQGLRLVRNIQHPYLLQIDRLDFYENYLLVVMELANGSLREEYVHNTESGHLGVPRERLIKMIRECAEALDELNIRHNIQHLDIKPENLFVVGENLKVGDFGLVRELHRQKLEDKDNAITPSYAAPELFKGYFTQHSDQYSLAVVYMEMLTGFRPYLGNDMRQLAFQHLTKAPDLSRLPYCDRETLEKALSRDPNQRFPSCSAFAKTLLEHLYDDSSIATIVTPSSLPTSNLTNPTCQLGPLWGQSQEETMSAQATARLTSLTRNVTASISNFYTTTVPPELFFNKLVYYAQNWEAELIPLHASAAALKFQTESNWAMNLLGKQDSLLVVLRLYQRHRDGNQTVIDATVSYHGRKIPERQFLQYAQRVLRLLQQNMMAAEAPANQIRQHPRTSTRSPATIAWQVTDDLEQNVIGTVLNMSSKGLGISVPSAVPLGPVQIKFPNSARVYRGRVVRCDRLGGPCHIGVAFAEEQQFPESLLQQRQSS